MDKQSLEYSLVFVVDTHALVFALAASKKLSKNVKEVFEKAEKKEVKIIFSIITILELIPLCEKKVLPINFEKLLEMILSHPSYEIFPLSFSIIKRISQLTQIKDLHDRAILATAQELDCPLITKDHILSKLQLVKTVW